MSPENCLLPLLPPSVWLHMLHLLLLQASVPHLVSMLLPQPLQVEGCAEAAIDIIGEFAIPDKAGPVHLQIRDGRREQGPDEIQGSPERAQHEPHGHGSKLPQ